MAVSLPPDAPPSFKKLNAVVVFLAAAIFVAVVLSFRLLWEELPLSRFPNAVWLPVHADLEEMIAHYTILPRISVSVLAGSGLAFSGVLFQQVLRNPLAEASTLGVSAGAYLAITVATLWFPLTVLNAPETVAFSGAVVALALSFALAWGGGASPSRFILAGLIVSLFCGVARSIIALFHHEALRSVFLWGSGSLAQNDWSAAIYLAPRLLVCFTAAILLLRPLTLLALEDEGAKGLGLPLAGIRLIGLLLAVAPAAFVVSAVGVIDFLGIAAPAIARLAGARSLRSRLLIAPIVGAILLWLADQLTQINPFTARELPIGIVTAVLGGPLLLWMLPRLRRSETVIRPRAEYISKRLMYPWILICGGLLILAVLVWIVLALGQNAAGWHFSNLAELRSLLEWRAPRVTAALAAGAMLAASGTLIQRMTGNAMASPEILGISSGACVGVILLFLFGITLDHGLKIFAASCGAFATLTLMLTLARGSEYSPERMLLTGVALGTVVGALLALLMVSGDPRMGSLLAWMAGSTYAVTAHDAWVACIVAILLMAIMPFAARWLEILPLGEVTARELGVHLARSRLGILVAAAVLTGAATLIVGPLSFVGLMGPHIARMAGFQRVLPHLVGSALVGAIIMAVADWLGRNLLFPYQVPAGLLATVVGGPYFMWLMWKGRK